MLIDQILLHILHKLNNERTINAAFHLLRGKRSGQTIQDVGLFKLYPFFGVVKKLPKQIFDESVYRLVQNQYIVIQEQEYYTLTPEGINKVKTLHIPYFDGWHYRGNEHVFFARLSLICQTLSNQSAGNQAFLPVQRSEHVQRWGRQFLRDTNYVRNPLQQPLFDEIMTTIQQATVTDVQRQIVINRLSGVHVAGVPWQQMATKWGISEFDCQLLFVSALHAWLEVIYKEQPMYLLRMAEQVRIDNVLTGSAFQTAQLYTQGYSLAQISEMRLLKMNTIEDHLVELAMNEPTFDIRPFLDEIDELAVYEAVQQYATKKLKVLREVLPHLSYFQIRLALAKGE